MKETTHNLIDPNDLTRKRTITIREDGVVVAIKEKELIRGKDVVCHKASHNSKA